MAHCLNSFRQKAARRLTQQYGGVRTQGFSQASSSTYDTTIKTGPLVPKERQDWFLRLRHLLGCAGYLTSKYETSPALQRARRSFLQGPPPSGDGIWVADCSFDELCQVMGSSWAGTPRPLKESPSSKFPLCICKNTLIALPSTRHISLDSFLVFRFSSYTNLTERGSLPM